MVDPKLVLVLLLALGTVWVGEKAIDGSKFIAHKTKCGIMRVVGKHCAPKVDPNVPTSAP